MKPLFVTGIGTGVGKTVISAILTEKLQADYWKPVQSGDLNQSDTMMVKSLIWNPFSRFHEEAYRFTQPFSPHKSARLDGVTIDIRQINLPKTDNQLIIEGAGGLMVPLNDQFLMIDLIQKFGAEVILVSRNYLGSINHTLLSISVLKERAIPVKGIVFNGTPDKSSEDFILNYSQLNYLGRIPELDEITISGLLEAITI